MCGIAGIWQPSGLNSAETEPLIRSMVDAIANRGPDDRDYWIDPVAGIALGHARLAIIDLSIEGRQPMRSNCGRFTAVFNGEIYNFRQLRAELSLLGRRFRGHSDTEVLLESIAEWGVDQSLRRFNGMFALALWDSRSRQLTLARDRAGEKPLYYRIRHGTVRFASELNSLLEVEPALWKLDRDALRSYFRWGYIPAPRTPVAGVMKVLPGTHVTLSEQTLGSGGTAAAYWSPARAFAGSKTMRRASADFSSVCEDLNTLLQDAVGLRMISDVPLGAFLSGGTDSSLIVALMQRISSSRIRTFSIGFDDPSLDESHHAAAVARHLGTDHSAIVVSGADALALVPTLAAAYDEPMSDASQIPTMLVSRLARGSVTVALSGDAGDELFGGYGRYPETISSARRLLRVPGGVRGAAARLVGQFGGAVKFAPPRFEPYAAWAAKMSEVLRAQSLLDVYRAKISHDARAASLVLHEVGECSGSTPPALEAIAGSECEQLMLFDFATYLCDDILAKVDRASMAVSLEARVPLLDPRVIEFAWTLSDDERFDANGGKRILKCLLDRYVPRSITGRKKMGFGVPLGAWLRGPLRDWAESLLDTRRLETGGILDARAVRAAWTCHTVGAHDRSSHLWDVLTFQAWLGRYQPGL